MTKDTYFEAEKIIESIAGYQDLLMKLKNIGIECKGVPECCKDPDELQTPLVIRGVSKDSEPVFIWDKELVNMVINLISNHYSVEINNLEQKLKEL